MSEEAESCEQCGTVKPRVGPWLVPVDEAIVQKCWSALDRDREALIEQAVDRAELTSSRQHLRGPEARAGYRARLREVIEVALAAIERADQEEGDRG